MHGDIVAMRSVGHGNGEAAAGDSLLQAIILARTGRHDAAQEGICFRAGHKNDIVHP